MPGAGWQHLMNTLAAVSEERRLWWTAYLYVGAHYEPHLGEHIIEAARHELEGCGTHETLKAFDLDVTAEAAVADLLGKAK